MIFVSFKNDQLLACLQCMIIENCLIHYSLSSITTHPLNVC